MSTKVKIVGSRDDHFDFLDKERHVVSDGVRFFWETVEPVVGVAGIMTGSGYLSHKKLESSPAYPAIGDVVVPMYDRYRNLCGFAAVTD